MSLSVRRLSGFTWTNDQRTITATGTQKVDPTKTTGATSSTSSGSGGLVEKLKNLPPIAIGGGIIAGALIVKRFI